MDDKIFRYLDFLSENTGPYVFQCENYVFRKLVGEEFPKIDTRVIYSVDYFAGGTKMLILIDILMGKLRIQYYHKNEVKQCLFEAVNQFREAYIYLVYHDIMK